MVLFKSKVDGVHKVTVNGRFYRFPRNGGRPVVIEEDIEALREGFPKIYVAEDDVVESSESEGEDDGLKASEDSDALLVDDYMDRNASTVKAALKEDDLGNGFLKSCLEYEEGNKDRKTVKSALRDELGE